jgi:hypothetical protein
MSVDGFLMHTLDYDNSTLNIDFYSVLQEGLVNPTVMSCDQTRALNLTFTQLLSLAQHTQNPICSLVGILEKPSRE